LLIRHEAFPNLPAFSILSEALYLDAFVMEGLVVDGVRKTSVFLAIVSQGEYHGANHKKTHQE
jgi:hypothetical protein